MNKKLKTHEVETIYYLKERGIPHATIAKYAHHRYDVALSTPYRYFDKDPDIDTTPYIHSVSTAFQCLKNSEKVAHHLNLPLAIVNMVIQKHRITI